MSHPLETETPVNLDCQQALSNGDVKPLKSLSLLVLCRSAGDPAKK